MFFSEYTHPYLLFAIDMQWDEFLVSLFAADTAPPTISQITPSNDSAGKVSVTAAITDASGILPGSAKVYYAVNPFWGCIWPYNWASQAAMTVLSGNSYKAILPDTVGNNDKVCIKVEANDASSNQYSASERYPNNPYIVSGVMPPDTTAPSAPQGLQASAASNSQINLSWAASSDNVGVSGYRIYRGGSLIATTAATSYQNTGLAPSTAYSYTVAAYDAAGNVSAQSVSASATTTAAPDTTAPSVSITAPVNGATVSGYVAISAGASDNVGITKVEFYVDNGLKNTDAAAPYSFTLDSTLLANGLHAILAKAYDAAGNNSASSKNIVVYNISADRINPAVSVDSPGSGAEVTGTTEIRASASDDGGVAKVDFIINGITYTDSAAPYSYPLNTLRYTNGVYSMTVRAYDLNSNTAEAVIGFSVHNQARTDTVITPTGGAILTPMVNIIVPPMSLAAPVTITVVDEGIDDAPLRAQRDARATLQNITPIASGFRLLPEGYTPAGKISIKLPLNHSVTVAATTEQILGVYAWDDATNTWQPLASAYNASDDTMNAETAAFSVYRLFSKVPSIQTSDVGAVYVFPNPAKRGAKPVFHIETDAADEVKIQIHDFAGRLIHTKILEEGPALLNRDNKFTYAYEYEWDAKNAASGVYFYVITINKGGGKTVRRGKFAVIN